MWWFVCTAVLHNIFRITMNIFFLLLWLYLCISYDDDDGDDNDDDIPDVHTKKCINCGQSASSGIKNMRTYNVHRLNVVHIIGCEYIFKCEENCSIAQERILSG